MADQQFLDNQKVLIRLLADGMTVDEAISVISGDPYLIPVDIVKEWVRDPDLLRAAIDMSNDLLGQAWGTMWKSIKRNAMLGSVPHSKLLIEFVQEKRGVPRELKIIFDDAVSGNSGPDVLEDISRDV